ncbi:MAG: hypothetical protein EXR93_05920 [Gemmatimonadetes bacterium]|nr:hypothetical protein [Gemmatimonadota bacterium]
MPAVLLLGAVLTASCRDLSIPTDRVIAIEVSTTAPKVAVGDTLRLSASALNGAGDVVSAATITWAPVDTGVGFTLGPSTGLLTGIKVGAWRVRAEATTPPSDTLRTDAITVTVIAAPAP